MIFKDFIQSFIYFLHFKKFSLYEFASISPYFLCVYKQPNQPPYRGHIWLDFFLSLAQPMYSAKTQKNSVLHFC